MKKGVIINGENLNVFPLRSGKCKGCLLLPPLFKSVLEFLAMVISQVNKIKSNKTGKLSLFVNNNLLHRKF